MAKLDALLKRSLRVILPPSRDTTHGAVADKLLLPDGPRQGKPYRWRDDPVHACLIEQLDLDRWDSFACPGAVQTGKSLALILVPALRQLIFQRRSVVYAQPSQQKLHEAWTGKVSPAISGAGLGGWLPTEGQGARGGQTPRFVVFRDPQTASRAGMLYLIHGGGKNEGAQASVSAPTVLVDEAGSFQSIHRIALIGKRADSFGAQAKRVYTSTVKKDGTMGEEDCCLMLSLYCDSTQSRLHFPCPHCGHWHKLEWANVRYEPDDEAEAAETVRMLCPKCEKPITEDERQNMLRSWRLVHAGQTVGDDGEVLGAEPKTRRFGLLWTALDSTLRDLPTLAIEHWRASQDLKRGSHDLMRSFYRDQLCEPYQDDLQVDEDAPSYPTRHWLEQRSKTSPLGAVIEDKSIEGDSFFSLPDVEGLRFWTVGVDVQRGGARAPGRFYWWARGETHEGQRLMLAAGTKCISPMGREPSTEELYAGFDALGEMMDELGVQVGMPHVGIGVDVGDRQDEIVPYLKKHDGWEAVKGGSSIKVDKYAVINGSRRLKQRKYRDVADVVACRWQSDRWWLFIANDDGIRSDIHRRLLLPQDDPGAYLIPGGLEANRAVIRHLCATAKIHDSRGKVRWSETARDKMLHPEWQKRCDYLDAAIYAEAIARQYYDHRMENDLPLPPQEQDLSEEVSAEGIEWNDFSGGWK